MEVDSHETGSENKGQSFYDLLVGVLEVKNTDGAGGGGGLNKLDCPDNDQNMHSGPGKNIPDACTHQKVNDRLPQPGVGPGRDQEPSQEHGQKARGVQGVVEHITSGEHEKHLGLSCAVDEKSSNQKSKNREQMVEDEIDLDFDVENEIVNVQSHTDGPRPTNELGVMGRDRFSQKDELTAVSELEKELDTAQDHAYQVGCGPPLLPNSNVFVDPQNLGSGCHKARLQEPVHDEAG